MISRKFKTIVLLLIASAVGLASSFIGGIVTREMTLEDYEDWQGLEREEGAYALRPPVSELNVVEVGVDSTGDGLVDQWAVYINENSDVELQYHLQDIDGDLDPDLLKVLIGNMSRNTTYTLHDDDGDGNPDRVGLTLGNFADSESYYVYQDLDFDGRIDVMWRVHNGKQVDSLIFYENNLYDAKDISSNCRMSTVFTDEGEWKPVVFMNHEWSPVEE